MCVSLGVQFQPAFTNQISFAFLKYEPCYSSSIGKAISDSKIFYAFCKAYFKPLTRQQVKIQAVQYVSGYLKAMNSIHHLLPCSTFKYISGGADKSLARPTSPMS